jgi:hypothetical protein
MNILIILLIWLLPLILLIFLLRYHNFLVKKYDNEKEFKIVYSSDINILFFVWFVPILNYVLFIYLLVQFFSCNGSFILIKPKLVKFFSFSINGRKFSLKRILDKILNA